MAETKLDRAIAEVKRQQGRETMRADELAPLLPEHLRQPFWRRAVERFVRWELGDDPCVFCEIVAEREPAVFVRRWTDAVAIVPLEPVTEGHVLVLPRVHVRDASEDPCVLAAVTARAVEFLTHPSQLITSLGLDDGLPPHLAVHVVPYQPEGEELPWVSELGDCPVCFRPRVRRNRKRAIWVVSDVAPDGTYVTTVQASDDVAVVLDRDRALAYAVALFTAVGYAEYDAAVLAQLTALGVGERMAAECVADLRADRAPVDDVATAPLRFVPLITAAKREPALLVEVNGKPVSQWTPADGRQHAGHVLDICAGVDLDAAYYRFLRGPVGLDEGRARAVVGTLGEHRIGGGSDDG